MQPLLAKGLMRKMIIFCLLVGVLMTGLVGYFFYASAQEALTDFVFRQIEADRKQTALSVQDYLSACMLDIKVLSHAQSIRMAAEVLSFFGQSGTGKTDESSSLNMESGEYKQLTHEIRPVLELWLEEHREASAYQDILIIVDKKAGLIGYTQKGLSDKGACLATGALKNSNLARLWKKVSESEKPAMVDFTLYEPAGAPSAFMGTPIFAEDMKKISGMLVVRLGPEKLQSLLKSTTIKWKSGNACVIGEAGTVRSFAGFDGRSPDIHLIDSEVSRASLSGKSGTGALLDKSGQPILCSWSGLGLPQIQQLGADFDWGIISSMDTGEALEPIRTLRNRIISIIALVGGLGLFVAFFFARSITKPVEALARQADTVGRGNLNTDISIRTGDDEIGSLARSFANMLVNIKDQLRQTQDGVSSLSAISHEVTSAVTELAAATAQSSTAVTETATITAQVKEAAKLSNQTAQNVVLRSRHAVEVSEAGKEGIRKTLQKMEQISGQMGSIEQKVTRLSEFSQEIESIIEWVQDLADQSNLLAVNAAIEAARAGEHGKGFAVVAQEVKSLADQSREATSKVRSILDETRKSIGEVVMAADQGKNAVISGLDQSRVTEDAIKSLAENVTGSAQAATVIQASSEQQLVGMEQVVSAVSNIENAVQNNIISIETLEASVGKLDDLGTALKALVEKYQF
jgi:methyl-accepting chemotaxis protein